MPGYLVVPTIFMTLAFAAYTTGVWSERIARDLKPWHVAAFWLGWAFDAYGTRLMNLMREAGRRPELVHSITGVSAFALMGIHAVWAAGVAFKGSREARAGFHRYSLVVWLLWLVPYFGGMIAGMLTARGL